MDPYIIVGFGLTLASLSFLAGYGVGRVSLRTRRRVGRPE